MKQQRNYKSLIIVLTLLALSIIANSIEVILKGGWFRWVNLGMGIICLVALAFVLTHRDYYIRNK
jgi:hypothetical protein